MSVFDTKMKMKIWEMGRAWRDSLVYLQEKLFGLFGYISCEEILGWMAGRYSHSSTSPLGLGPRNPDPAMRYAQLVIGIKGHGKTTYCKLMGHYAESKGRKVKIVNLDAKAQTLNYDRMPTADIRDIISEDDYYKAERSQPGTGAGFSFILSRVVEKPEWLFNQIGEVGEEDHVLFDCPAEREYFAHVKEIKVLCTELVMRNFRVCIVYVRDCTLCHNGYEYICSCLSPLTSFINLSIPHVNVYMKYDKLTDEEKSRLQLFMNSDIRDVLRFENGRPTDQPDPELVAFATSAMQILDGHSLVRKKYFPLDAKDDNSFKSLLFLIDEVQGISED